jgi:hypothetical protein
MRKLGAGPRGVNWLPGKIPRWRVPYKMEYSPRSGFDRVGIGLPPAPVPPFLDL